MDHGRSQLRSDWMINIFLREDRDQSRTSLQRMPRERSRPLLHDIPCCRQSRLLRLHLRSLVTLPPGGPPGNPKNLPSMSMGQFSGAGARNQTGVVEYLQTSQHRIHAARLEHTTFRRAHGQRDRGINVPLPTSPVSASNLEGTSIVRGLAIRSRSPPKRV